MSDEDLSIAIWLPLHPDELTFLQNMLQSAGVLVPGNYAGDDPYILVDYLAVSMAEDCEFRSLFDRNLTSPLVALASGASVPTSTQAYENTRLAAACASFCILAEILIEPNISLYEFASTYGHEAACSDAHFFRVADNSDAMAYLDIALGRADRLPPAMLEHVRSLADVSAYELKEKNFGRTLTMWKPNYLYALKTVALRRSGLSPLESAMALTRWQAEEAFFNAPAALYCLAAIAHAPPKGGMLKGILSENLTALRAGLRNATWDMCLLQQFGRSLKKADGARWSLWSTDVAVRDVAKSLFLRENETAVDKLPQFYERYWGQRDGWRLFAAYLEASSVVHVDIEARQSRTKVILDRIDEYILKLEDEIGLSEA